MGVRIDLAGPVTVLTLDRPEARNAVDAPTAVRLAAATCLLGEVFSPAQAHALGLASRFPAIGPASWTHASVAQRHPL